MALPSPPTSSPSPPAIHAAFFSAKRSLPAKPKMNLDEFSNAVESGLKLSKRIYVGKDRSLSPPRATFVEKSSEAAPSYEPTAPMVYAVISDPAIVDNPDLPSYQPYVHGQCDPPALIPLHMTELKMDVDCYLDRVFVSAKGSWRVHCVMGSRSCDCRVVVPMGEQVMLGISESAVVYLD